MAQDSRDDLDRLLARATRAARRPQGLPADGGASDEDILRVVDGTASKEERTRVEADAAALAKVETLRSALAETGHAPTVFDRVARYVFVFADEALTLLRSASEPVALPAAVAVRGSAQARDAFYEFLHPLTEGGASLKIEHVVRGKAPSIDVAVSLPGLPGARVSLWRGGEAVDSVPVDAQGGVIFAGLSRDRYELVFSRAGADLGRISLDFIAG
jgi:hypothetical protein